MIDLKKCTITFIAQLLKIIFYPFLKLKEDIIFIKNNDSGNAMYVIKSGFIFLLTFAGIIYYTMTPIEQNGFYKIFKALDVLSKSGNNIVSWTLAIISVANAANYIGNFFVKLYCYKKFGDPYLYFTENQLEKIAEKLSHKGHTNINKEILLEIIKFCIKNLKYNSTSIIGGKQIDWRSVIVNLFNSDLEFFLSQQQILRIKRKEIIKKILSFYVYHQHCHQEANLLIETKQSNLTRTETDPLIEKAIEQTNFSFANFPMSDANYSSIQGDETECLDEFESLEEEYFNISNIFNQKILLIETNESATEQATIQHLERGKKEYHAFKNKYLEQHRNYNLSRYSEYILLNEYERYLYSKAEKISVNIFPDEIIQTIAPAKILQTNICLSSSRKNSQASLIYPRESSYVSEQSTEIQSTIDTTSSSQNTSFNKQHNLPKHVNLSNTNRNATKFRIS